MTLEEYKKQFSEDDAVGWLCIDEKVDALYPNQKPQHFATLVKYMLGGKDPLDGISVYESKQQTDHFHIVSYGLSELYYNEKSCGGEFSKFGFEFTIRIKKGGDNNVNWAMNLMQNLARYVFTSGKWFEEFHVIPANGPIRLEYDTDLTALAFVLDPELGKMQTPHGEVQFLQIVGITTQEYEAIKQAQGGVLANTQALMEKLQTTNPLLIIDLDRKS